MYSVWIISSGVHSSSCAKEVGINNKEDIVSAKYFNISLLTAFCVTVSCESFRKYIKIYFFEEENWTPKLRGRFSYVVPV